MAKYRKYIMKKQPIIISKNTKVFPKIYIYIYLFIHNIRRAEHKIYRTGVANFSNVLKIT